MEGRQAVVSISGSDLESHDYSPRATIGVRPRDPATVADARRRGTSRKRLAEKPMIFALQFVSTPHL